MLQMRFELETVHGSMTCFLLLRRMQLELDEATAAFADEADRRESVLELSARQMEMVCLLCLLVQHDCTVKTTVEKDCVCASALE